MKIMTLCEVEFQLFVSQPSVISRLTVTHEATSKRRSSEDNGKHLILGLSSHYNKSVHSMAIWNPNVLYGHRTSSQLHLFLYMS